jgi:hypothetical protein
MSYGLDNRGSVPGRGRDFSLHHRLQTGSGVHPISYTCTIVIRGSFPGVKRPGREADLHLVPRLGMRRTKPACPHVFMAWGLVKHRDNFKITRYNILHLHIKTQSSCEVNEYDFGKASSRMKSRDSSVGIALGYGLDDRGSISGGCFEFFCKPPRPERLWGPPSLLSNGYQGLFPWG